MFRLQASKVSLAVLSAEPMTSGSVGIYEVSFDFSQDWDGLDRTAVFRAGEAAVSVPLINGDACHIPWEVLENPVCNLQAGVYGTRAGELVMPTRWASLGSVLRGTSLGETETPPPADLYGEILAAASEAVRIANKALAGSGGTGLPELGHALYYDGLGHLAVQVANAAQEDNTLPITSAAVAVSIGNIDALLGTI